MTIVISLTMAVLPSIILIQYFYKQDIAKPEPKLLVLKVFTYGFFVIIPMGFVLYPLYLLFSNIEVSPLLKALIQSYIAAALCEETAKLLVVRFAVYKHKKFDEIMDGIIYTIAASLGFACLENIMYVLEGGIPVAISRALFSVPLHAIASGIMGYYIGKAKFAPNKKKEHFLMFKGLFIGILIHGFYNFVIFFSEIADWDGFWVLAPFALVCFYILEVKIEKAVKADFKAGRITQGNYKRYLKIRE